MTKTADVVIIGGGVVGSSIAYHLAEAGCTKVVVVEREAQQGLGSTGRATGGVRAQFATPINIRMSLYSIDFFACFEEATGHPSGYKPAGYLFLATSEQQLAYLEANRERQRAEGLKNVEIIGVEEIGKLMPQLRTDDLTGGSFCQTDGFISPLDVMRGFMNRACERGVELWTETRVSGIEVEEGSIAKVLTTQGEISTRAVVNAAGAWAAEVAGLAGVEIPVAPLRRQIVGTTSFDGMPQSLPMIIDMSNGFHFRSDLQAGSTKPTGVLMAWPDPDETEGFKTDFDSSFTSKILKRAVNRVPDFARVKVKPERCRTGLYEMTPDHHAIIGESKQVRGLFFANGFSGHGVMHSPATGRIISELVLHGEARTLDISSLDAERFTEGRLLEETTII
jgi:sarcosine oxidase subunit beta